MLLQEVQVLLTLGDTRATITRISPMRGRGGMKEQYQRQSPMRSMLVFIPDCWITVPLLPHMGQSEFISLVLNYKLRELLFIFQKTV